MSSPRRSKRNNKSVYALADGRPRIEVNDTLQDLIPINNTATIQTYFVFRSLPLYILGQLRKFRVMCIFVNFLHIHMWHAQFLVVLAAFACLLICSVSQVMLPLCSLPTSFWVTIVSSKKNVCWSIKVWFKESRIGVGLICTSSSCIHINWIWNISCWSFQSNTLILGWFITVRCLESSSKMEGKLKCTIVVTSLMLIPWYNNPSKIRVPPSLYSRYGVFICTPNVRAHTYAHDACRS